MRNKIFPIVALAMIMLVGACSSDDLIPEIAKKISKPAAARTISLTINTPPEDDPNTRVALNQEGKNIALTWEVGDELKLAFVQEGKTTVNRTVPITNIDNGGKTAKFEIAIPADFDQTLNFKLYGVYGGGALTGTTVTLPANAGSATSLKGTETTSVQKRKDVMLRFQSEVVVGSSNVAVTFQHLGSLFCITLTNNTGDDFANIQEARLVGIDNSSNVNWAYNFAAGGQTFDLATGEFQNRMSGGNYISFKASKTTLEKQKTITYWAWYPPLSDKTWPALQLQLRDGTAVLQTSANSTKARTEATVAGKSFYFYAGWDGTELTITREYSGTVEELRALSEEERKTIRKLTLTGDIYKADYEMMKNDMPNLTYVDLSAAISYGSINSTGTVVVNTIPYNAFGGSSKATANQNITSVVLPTAVIEIGVYAFSECNGLTGELVLPAGLKIIGDHAFNECKKLTGSLTIPSGVTEIEHHAFYNCQGFDGTLKLSSDLVTVGANAFRMCINFSGTLTIPSAVTTIEDNAFLNCTKLTKLIFEDKISTNKLTIGKLAFQYCKAVVGVVILPKGLSSMDKGAFCTCNLVTALRFSENNPITLKADMLCKNTASGTTPHPVQVPPGSLSAYTTAWQGVPDGTITEY